MKTQPTQPKVLVFLFLVLCRVSTSATYEVPTDFETIQAAIDAAVDGDEIIVLPGRYVENVAFQGKNIQLRSTDPTDPQIIAATIIDGHRAGSVVTFAGTEGPDCLLSGFTISGGKAEAGGGINGGDVAYTGSGGTRAKIRNNVIRDNLATAFLIESKGGGLYACDGVIEGNVIEENSARGLFYVFGYRRTLGMPGLGGGLATCHGLIQNNMIAHNKADWGHGGGLAGCSNIRNNTIVANTASTVSVEAGVVYGGRGGGLYQCFELTNNILWDNLPVQIQDCAATPTFCCIQNWSGGGTGNIALDPVFVDQATGNYRLRPDSPCIDAGTFILRVTADFTGRTRPVDGSPEPRGDGSDYDIGAYEFDPTSLPEFRICAGDFGPAAPVIVQPGDPIALGAFLENTGSDRTDPAWLEVWGSRTGGLTLDTFLSDSLRLPSLASGETLPFSENRSLYNVPDGRYTLVYTVDRPDEVVESDETNNREVVVGKSLLVIRPDTQIDLAIEDFAVPPGGRRAGWAIEFGGRVVNRGRETSGPFWIEFWRVFRTVYGVKFLASMATDSIRIPSLAPDETVDLSEHLLTVRVDYPADTWILCFVDRADNINEQDETNNYAEAHAQPPDAAQTASALTDASKQHMLADLRVTAFDFAPMEPGALAVGAPVAIHVVVENRGPNASRPFWIEYRGSLLGGWTPNIQDILLLDPSDYCPSLEAGEQWELTATKMLLGVPDGRWTVMAFAKPYSILDPNWENNSFAVAGKRLLTVTPPKGANLVLEDLSLRVIEEDGWGKVLMSGRVRNVGTESSGQFWVEFWRSYSINTPHLDAMLGQSIRIDDLVPNEETTFTEYTVKWVPGGVPAGWLFGCFVDRADQVRETDETDNYRFLPAP